mgnify:FL=1
MSANKQDRAFVITRHFDAALPHVWKAWSTAAEMQSWWGPKGCSIKVAAFEFRPGGFFHYAMHFPEREPMWGRFLYRNIDKHTRITWLNSFSNETCGITRAPFDMAIPLEILNDVRFAETNGSTIVTLRALPHGASEDEIKTFEGMTASLAEGYGGTFDQLAAALAKSA